MSCGRPIDSAVLADYWIAALPSAEEAAVEEHVFSCDECAARLSEVTAMAEGVRSLARRANLRMIVSDSFLERAAEEGLRVREYLAAPGERVECTVAREDDIIIGRLQADFSGVRQVDLCYCDPSGVEQFRITDVPVQAKSNCVAVQEPIEWAKAAPSNLLIYRLIARDEAGGERTLGEYTFNHTRTIAD